MAAGKKGSSSRKVKDKWKAKEWYKVRAPRMFNEVEIGDTPSADPEYLIGRTSEVTVQDLTGDFSKMHIKLKFKITEVDGYDAKTVFTGQDLTVDYVRRLTRRKKTKTDHVVDIVTKDGFGMRIKTMSIADNRIQTSQEEAMRRIIGETIVQMGKEMTIADIIKSVISGDMAKTVARACRVVIPIKRIEIRKSEVTSRGNEEPGSIIEAQPAEEEEPESPDTKAAEAEEPEVA
ncbi:MAG: 30S ribosomal protein S3ae [Methanomassiliicoccaceae archaeon]|nr:30S ribosomal protein S3ae [Methanomassiliicoccaceae archaeon]